MDKNRSQNKKSDNPSDDSDHKRRSFFARGWKESSFPDWLIAGLTAVIAFVGFLQWKVISGQLEEAVKQFQISHRPWVDVVEPIEIIEPLKFDDRGAHLAIRPLFRNAGTAPAIGTLVVNSGLKVGPPPLNATEARRIVDCQKAVFEHMSDNAGRLIVAGGQASIDIIVLEETRTNFRPTPLGMLVWFPLCIRYKDEAGNYHATGAIWQYLGRGNQRFFTGENKQIEGTLGVMGIGPTAY